MFLKPQERTMANYISQVNEPNFGEVTISQKPTSNKMTAAQKYNKIIGVTNNIASIIFYIGLNYLRLQL